VTQKIIRAAGRIARGERNVSLQLGNLDIKRDWGWAAEDVEAIRLIVRHSSPEDFVIATGECTTLRDFTAEAFRAFQLDWRDHVTSTHDLMRPSDILVSVGRPVRAQELLGWTAQIRMPDVVRRLAAAEIAAHEGG
jgi:GDPmannose 4,6-dehydratase